MVRHIVMWNFKEGFTAEQKKQYAERIKTELEALADVVPGVVSVEVVTQPLTSSNRELVLNSLFESAEALANYQTHPDHVKAGQFIGSVAMDRTCGDYVEN
ncbi:Dabb family protein [Scatolibacter rhodanostii]|uniref:Dabb family protein n=1 Tax=Scatolibacter rhodanostii TaxID=2014781 RepID=UPI000C071BCA|nr:Dabb family protein [Scatolibacter rhodanostii]